MNDPKTVIHLLIQALVAAEDFEYHEATCDLCGPDGYLCTKGEAMGELAISLRNSALRDSNAFLTADGETQVSNAKG